jgi:hypothetical protein
LLVIDKYKVAYLHINKTAGTSIKAHLTDVVGPKNVRQMGPTHGPLSANTRILGNRFNNYTILVSIRNPFARLMSIYLFRRTRFEEGDRTSVTQAAYNKPLKQWFTDVVRKSQRLTDLSITDSILVGGELLPNVSIIAMETLNKDFDRFRDDVLKIRTNKRMPHLNKTNYGWEYYTKYFDDELIQAVYEWDEWVIDEYYPWII